MQMAWRPKIVLASDDEASSAQLVILLGRLAADLMALPLEASILKASLKERTALVVLDAAATAQTSTSLVAQLRSDPATRDIPVLIVVRQRDGLHSFVPGQCDVVNLAECSVPEAALLGKVQGMLEQQRVRDALRESERRAAAILAATDEGVVGLDRDGRIQFANAAAQRMLGLDEQNLLGCSLQKFLVERRGGRRRTWYSHRIARAFRKTGRLRCDRESFRRADASTFPVEFTANPVTDESLELDCVLVFRDITRRREQEAQLLRMAWYDPLTGLVNRAQFYANLDDAIQRAKRQRDQLGVIFLDLDNFKLINDRLGHEMGDRVLIALAERLRTRFRGVDKLGRFGGDEFLILVEGVRALEDLHKIGQEIIVLVCQPFLIEGHELHVTASVGGALYPSCGRDGSTLVRSADSAMYRAKHRGRNRYVAFDEATPEAGAPGPSTRSALLRALENDELELHFQPRVDVATGEVQGFEALVRWNHPELGMLSPGLFVPAAEETGVIAALGEWVLRSACAQVERWRGVGLWTADMVIGVNVSALQLGTETTPWSKEIERVLRAHGLDGEMLEIEVSENAVMQNAAALSALERLSERGLRIAIDDFGTGHSSLIQLQRLAVRTLKIDPSLLRDVELDHGGAAIVSTIIRMGDGLAVNVVAEGVEQEGQARFLRRAGCPQAQGFHFSPPLAAAGASTLLEQGHRLLGRARHLM
jgi:diguanylate cyclase (GGDEF)-like protein/PAS domain S-box-containing protein